MKSQILIVSLLVVCLSPFTIMAQVTKGLHFYMPFNEGQGKVAKTLGRTNLRLSYTRASSSPPKERLEARLNLKVDRR